MLVSFIGSEDKLVIIGNDPPVIEFEIKYYAMLSMTDIQHT